eukprot:3554684-Prymnesium_polylepis.1
MPPSSATDGGLVAGTSDGSVCPARQRTLATAARERVAARELSVRREGAAAANGRQRGWRQALAHVC